MSLSLSQPATAAFLQTLQRVPASFFGMVLGIAGLGAAWRAAHRVWGLPAPVGEALMLTGALLWATLMLLYAAKWLLAREHARREAADPIQCCFIGLVGVTTSLIAAAALPYSRPVAVTLFALGALFTLGFGLWRTGGLWQGGRDHRDTTPVLYLPTVAGMFVTATVASALGWPDGGQLAFGAGLFSWLAIESVLLHRLLTERTLPAPLRPTLGIQLAPPLVGTIAYLGMTAGPPDVAAHVLLGYGLLQALVLLRLLPWIAQQPFGPSYWSFSFGATALATVPLRMVERGEAGAVAALAAPAFIFANLVIAILAAGTIRLALRRRLLPPTAPTTDAA